MGEVEPKAIGGPVGEEGQASTPKTTINSAESPGLASCTPEGPTSYTDLGTGQH